MSREILIGPERRRRWSDAEKIAIVVVTVAAIARRYGITRQQIYRWRSDMRQVRLVDEDGGPFLAVEFVGDAGDDGGPSGRAGCAALIEVGLRRGRVLRVPASVPATTLTSLVRAVEAA